MLPFNIRSPYPKPIFWILRKRSGLGFNNGPHKSIDRPGNNSDQQQGQDIEQRGETYGGLVRNCHFFIILVYSFNILGPIYRIYQGVAFGTYYLMADILSGPVEKPSIGMPLIKSKL